MSLQNKTAVITGATSGVGAAIAAELLRNGAQPVNISRRTAPDCVNFSCDISNISQLQHAVCGVAEKFGKIDFLFCNAGFGLGGGVESADVADVERLFAVNVVAHIQAVKMFLPYINDGGKIFFTGSLASVIPLPYQACYSASKAALENFSRALNTELLPHKISACVVLLGDVRTGFTDSRIKATDGSRAQTRGIEKMERSERRGKNPETVAKAVVKLARKKRVPHRVAIGFGNKILCFLVRILPVRFVDFLVRKIYI